jgi:hypothetical protein
MVTDERLHCRNQLPGNEKEVQAENPDNVKQRVKTRHNPARFNCQYVRLGQPGPGQRVGAEQVLAERGRLLGAYRRAVVGETIHMRPSQVHTGGSR